jgi:hypothetical protein
LVAAVEFGFLAIIFLLQASLPRRVKWLLRKAAALGKTKDDPNEPARFVPSSKKALPTLVALSTARPTCRELTNLPRPKAGARSATRREVDLWEKLTQAGLRGFDITALDKNILFDSLTIEAAC